MGDRTRTAGTRIAILWRGERGDERPAEDRGLTPLFDAFARLGAAVVPLPFGDDRVGELRPALLGCDGVLAWVNPIQDGATRAPVDRLLSEAAGAGLFVSAHPEVIVQMGTKEVLHRTRHLDWGCDTGLYRSVGELAERLPARLARHGRLVVKQGRGNGGNGVFAVSLTGPVAQPGPRTPVRVQDALAPVGPGEPGTLGGFIERCAGYFAWSGVVVDQPYQARLAEGMIRCYLSHDEVVGFCHQWPTGLLDPGAPVLAHGPRVMEGPDATAFVALRRRVEGDWVPAMAAMLGLAREALPVIWDADFLYGPRDAAGEDSFVLGEINVSAVWPFPPTAAVTIATNTLAQSRARGAGGS